MLFSILRLYEVTRATKENPRVKAGAGWKAGPTRLAVPSVADLEIPESDLAGSSPFSFLGPENDA